MEIKAFDLFAGIGGFRAGVVSATGLDVRFVGHCEFDKFAVQTYRAMYDVESEAHLGDLCEITRLPGEEDTAEKLPNSRKRQAQIRDRLPAFDLLVAGFPCQPHSLMGNRRGRRDQRGSLFYDIAEVLRAMRPRHFVLENVRAIKSVNGGAFFDDILATVRDDLGYTVQVWELNAVEYGTPQIRRRLFIVGSENGLPVEPPPRVPVEQRQYRTTWHLLEREVEPKYYLSERILGTILKHKHKGYSRKAEINRLTARPLTRTMHKMHRASQDNYYSNDFIQGIYDPEIEGVHRASDGSDAIRRLTPREALRIQSFPEDLIERATRSGTSDTQLYMQAGNAVPPCLVRAVIDHAFGPANE